MRVTLELDETLEVALVEQDRIVGTLSLSLRSSGSSKRAVSTAAPAPRAAQSSGGRRGKRNISPEARERMAEAQRRRWAKYRKEKG